MFWSLKRSITLPSSYPSGSPTFTRLGGSVRTLGIMKRKVASVISVIEPTNVVHANANQLPRKNMMMPRRSSSGFLAGGFGAAAGFGGGAGAAAGVGAGLGVTGSDMQQTPESRVDGRVRFTGVK